MHTKQSELYTRAQVMYSYILYPDIQICILPTSISEGSLLAIYNIVDLLSCGKLASSVSLLFLLYFALEEEDYWSHWSHHRTGHSSVYERYPPENDNYLGMYRFLKKKAKCPFFLFGLRVLYILFHFNSLWTTQIF